MYGFDPVVQANDYIVCQSKCDSIKHISARASKMGTTLVNEYYAACLGNTKMFNHLNHRWEIDKLREMQCMVVKYKTNIAFLKKM